MRTFLGNERPVPLSGVVGASVVVDAPAEPLPSIDASRAGAGAPLAPELAVGEAASGASAGAPPLPATGPPAPPFSVRAPPLPEPPPAGARAPSQAATTIRQTTRRHPSTSPIVSSRWAAL